MAQFFACESGNCNCFEWLLLTGLSLNKLRKHKSKEISEKATHLYRTWKNHFKSLEDKPKIEVRFDNDTSKMRQSGRKLLREALSTSKVSQGSFMLYTINTNFLIGLLVAWRSNALPVTIIDFSGIRTHDSARKRKLCILSSKPRLLPPIDILVPTCIAIKLYNKMNWMGVHILVPFFHQLL